MSQLDRTTASAQTTLVDLNDDVLREIFEKLSDRDLSAIADTNSDLARNARAVFSARYTHKCFIFRCYYKDDLRRMHSIVRNFGSTINSLEGQFDAVCSRYKPQLVECIVEFCGETLNELCLTYTKITASTIATMEPLMRRLRKITLYGCIQGEGYDASAMYSQCGELETLAFKRNKTLGFPFDVSFPKLKSLIANYTGGFDARSLEGFLQLNPQLKELALNGCWSMKSQIFSILARCATQIEKFVMSDCDESAEVVEQAKHLRELTALKWLEIDCLKYPYNFSPVICELAANHVPLKCLKVSNCKVGKELFTEISKLEHLITLHLSEVTVNIIDIAELSEMAGRLDELVDFRLFLHNDVSVIDYLPVIRAATKLKYFELRTHSYYSNVYNIDMYTQILNAVQKRNGGGRLEISLWHVSNRSMRRFSQFKSRLRPDVLKITTNVDDMRPYTM